MDTLRDSRLARTDWQIIKPNEYGDWIGQRSARFTSLHPLTESDLTVGVDSPTPIFIRRTLGLVTSRDAWCYSSSRCQLQDNISRAIAFYNRQVKALHGTTKLSGSATQRAAQAKKVAVNDPRQFHWDAKNYRDLANGEYYSLNENGSRVSVYRPFFKQHLYFDRRLNNSIRDFPEIYPTPDADNLGIYITGPGSSVPFSLLMTNAIADSGLTSGNGSSPYIPRYHFTLRDSSHHLDKRDSYLERISNINPEAVAEFRTLYGDSQITEDDLFYYVYAVLHSPSYRKMFANDLAKSHVRIPVVASRADFGAFVEAGIDLADLHVNYENVEPYPLEEICSPLWNPSAQDAFLVTKMRYAGPVRNPDKSRIVYNAHITLVGIPSEAHRYTLGSRSALDWLIERYQVRTHKKSGIVNDPNDWATEVGDSRYIIELVKRVTTVSVRTVEIVEGLPELDL